ncbi:hypothetical protein PSHT_04652 [Puccinia striiformis]|uniref:Uncharacterized protein n=2 Tax=Puccinia striiformis TaxID=27350 RepID=A0A2S4WCH2_9BASI|nr:hypothetical protein PSTT_11639 [Puccinia striiformis]POW19449.1 hypothetical protein PSHT_04652 [Puccinia striiformis]
MAQMVPGTPQDRKRHHRLGKDCLGFYKISRHPAKPSVEGFNSVSQSRRIIP